MDGVDTYSADVAPRVPIAQASKSRHRDVTDANDKLFRNSVEVRKKPWWLPCTIR